MGRSPRLAIAGLLLIALGWQSASAAQQRYAATDPLCCPSATFMVEYTVDRSGAAPVLVPERSTRNPP